MGKPFLQSSSRSRIIFTCRVTGIPSLQWHPTGAHFLRIVLPLGPSVTQVILDRIRPSPTPLSPAKLLDCKSPTTGVQDQYPSVRPRPRSNARLCLATHSAIPSSVLSYPSLLCRSCLIYMLYSVGRHARLTNENTIMHGPLPPSALIGVHNVNGPVVFLAINAGERTCLSFSQPDHITSTDGRWEPSEAIGQGCIWQATPRTALGLRSNSG